MKAGLAVPGVFPEFSQNDAPATKVQIFVGLHEVGAHFLSKRWKHFASCAENARGNPGGDARRFNDDFGKGDFVISVGEDVADDLADGGPIRNRRRR